MHYLKVGLLLALSVMLMACARYKKNEDIYKTAQSEHRIVVPAGALAPKQEPYDPVPTVEGEPLGKFSLIPPGSRVKEYMAEKKSK